MSRLRDLRERWLADTMESVIYPNVVEAINEVLLERITRTSGSSRNPKALKNCKIRYSECRLVLPAG